jgi:uncharacterized HAD superfamily protein
MKIVLGLDLDGCLYPWHEAVYTYQQYMCGYSKSFNEFWDEVQFWPKEKQDYLVSLPFLYETQVPLESTTKFLEFCKENADEIYYITHRPPELERITKRYFRRYDFPYQDNLFITGDKATACRYLGVTHFLDDHVKHIQAVNGIADTYLMAKPWNKEFQDEFKTVRSLNEFKERVFS